MCDRDCVPNPERRAARDDEEAAGNDSEERAPGGGVQDGLEIGEQHSLQGVPGRGPDKGGDTAEAEEEEHARFTGRARGRAVLRSAVAVGGGGAWGVRAASGRSGSGLCRPRRGCSGSGVVHRRGGDTGNRTSGCVSGGRATR